LNISNNSIKYLSEDVCKSIRSLTTLDVSNNKLESLDNFEHFDRVRRLVAKNNHIRILSPIKQIDCLYELDLEGNAVDSHIDFLEFIKNKNDLIVVNLQMNPIMVEVDSIEKLNDDLI
jgi:Leucine-rich repeat (LRR) protein